MSKRLTDAVASILSDPENRSRTAEEVAELAIDCIRDHDARSRRLAVVGQISYGPQEPTRTVVLGPFTARGLLDSQAKFDRAVEGGSAARTAGQDLAWDPVTRKGRGRFMLAPAFMKPRDAWDAFRPQGEDLPDTWRVCRDKAAYERIRHTVEQWEAGRWAEVSQRGPACQCGLAEHYIEGNRGYAQHGVPTGHCHVHGRGVGEQGE